MKGLQFVACVLMFCRSFVAWALRPEQEDQFIEVGHRNFKLHVDRNTEGLEQAHEKETSDASTHGCTNIYAQCRADKEKRIEITRAKTVGQHFSAVGRGIVGVVTIMGDVMTTMAVHNARMDYADGGGVSTHSMIMVHQHGLYGPADTGRGFDFNDTNAKCSTITFKIGKGTSFFQWRGKESLKQMLKDSEGSASSWPSADALATSACQKLAFDLDHLGNSLSRVLHACMQHSALCGNEGICSSRRDSWFSSEIQGEYGKSCDESLALSKELVKDGGLSNPLVSRTFDKPSSEDPLKLESADAGSPFTMASWEQPSLPANSSQNYKGYLVALQDALLGERCVMSLNHESIGEKFDNLLSPRGVVILPLQGFDVFRVQLKALEDTGKPAGCEKEFLSTVPKPCGGNPNQTSGNKLFGVGQVEMEGCGRGKTQCGGEQEFVCCPKLTHSGLAGGTNHAYTLHEHFIEMAQNVIAEIKPSNTEALVPGDLVLAAAGGCFVEDGDCITRGAIKELVRNWMYGGCTLTLWTARRSESSAWSQTSVDLVSDQLSSED